MNGLDGRVPEMISWRATGLVRTMVLSRGQTVRGRVRGRTLLSLTETLATLGVDGEIRAEEPDGARWSVSVAGASAVRPDPFA